MKHKDPLTLYLPSKKILSLVSKLADNISKDYARRVSQEHPLTLVVVLRGAFFFAGDLIRRLRVPVLIDFVRLASYGSGTQSSGVVKLIKDIETVTERKHVLIIDDVVDTGLTLSFLKDRLELTSPKSLKICALLNKPARREVNIKLDYWAIDVEDKFLVGYGLDFNEKYRNLPDLFILN